MAIEIEKKFLLSEQDEQRLLAGAELVAEKSIDDAYYDTADYSLTLRDHWLRQRGERFELKVPLIAGENAAAAVANQYYELETDNEIREAIDLPLSDASLAVDLATHGYTPFISAHTQRRSYKKDGFTIDVDRVTYDNSDFTYAISEIELLVDDEADAPGAVEKIVAYAKERGLRTDQAVIGKVGAYLELERPEHYQKFVEGGVL